MRRFVSSLLLLGLLSGPASAAEAARGKIESRLQRAGFELVGEARRKGEFLVMHAARDGITWLLVVDGRTGQIVGEKPLGLPASAAD